MRSIAGCIAVVLVLTFGWSVTALSAQPGGMGEHQMAAMTLGAPQSGECLMCHDGHVTMSASACSIACIGAAVPSTPALRVPLRPGRFEAAAAPVLTGRPHPPALHPPKLSRV